MRPVSRLVVLAVAVVLSMASAAQQPAGQQQGGDPTGCDLFCNHYLGCKGMLDQNNYGQCMNVCYQSNPNPDVMVQYAQTDCQTAIALIDGQGGQGGQGGYAAPAGGQGGQAGGPRPGDKECEGCKRWGEQCIWASESNWGSGPYSGAAADCAQSCCP